MQVQSLLILMKSARSGREKVTVLAALYILTIQDEDYLGPLSSIAEQPA